MLLLTVLVVESAGGANPVAVLAPVSSGAKVVAQIEGQPVEVRPGVRQTAAALPLVVVLEFSGSLVDDACVIEKFLTGLPDWRERAAKVLVSGTVSRSFLFQSDFAPGTSLVVLSSNALQNARVFCGATTRSLDRGSGPLATIDGPAHGGLIEALAHTYRGNGPIRALWLASRFDWFDARTTTAWEGGIEATNWETHNPIQRILPHYTEAGISIFPVLCGRNRRGKRDLRRRETEARYLAREAGGWYSASGIQATLAATDQWPVVELELPPVSRTWTGRARELRIGTTAEAAVLRRPFQLEDTGSASPPQSAPALPAPMELTSAGSLNVAPSLCRTDGKEPTAGFALALPPASHRPRRPGPGASLHVFIQPLQGEPNAVDALGTEMVRRIKLEGPMLAAPSVCVPFARVVDGAKYAVVVHDADSRWTGVADLTLVRAVP